MPPHGFQLDTVENTGVHGATYDEIFANTGEEIDIDPHRNVMIGTIVLRSNSRHNLRHGDRLWFSLNGYNSSGPIINVYSGYIGNRNFGAPANMRRSNMRNIGYLSRTTWHEYNSTRGDSWDQTGPRMNQVWRSKCNMYFVGKVEDNRLVNEIARSPIHCYVMLDWR